MKSNRKDLAELRRQAEAVAGGVCEWPGCDERGEEMAHLEHRKMGGSIEVNHLRNVAWLCKWHHDIFDGRQLSGSREAVRNLMAGYLRLSRKPFA